MKKLGDVKLNTVTSMNSFANEFMTKKCSKDMRTVSACFERRVRGNFTNYIF